MKQFPPLDFHGVESLPVAGGPGSAVIFRISLVCFDVVSVLIVMTRSSSWRSNLSLMMTGYKRCRSIDRYLQDQLSSPGIKAGVLKIQRIFRQERPHRIRKPQYPLQFLYPQGPTFWRIRTMCGRPPSNFQKVFHPSGVR